MNVKTILQNMPLSVIDKISEQTGVDGETVSRIMSAVSNQLETGGDWLDTAKDMLDKDGDGQIMDDLQDLAGSFLQSKK